MSPAGAGSNLTLLCRDKEGGSLGLVPHGQVHPSPTLSLQMWVQEEWRAPALQLAGINCPWLRATWGCCHEAIIWCGGSLEKNSTDSLALTALAPS